MDNAEIARTLDAYAALLDLAGAAHWGVRAYRRAADLIRTTPAPVEELVRTGRVRELRGIGPGIERRLRELVETGRIAELEELEREVEPELVALGRYLGLGPQRLVALGRALGIRSADELREAAEAGRLREVPGVGPATEAKVLAALSREPQPARRGLTRNRALTLADAIAQPLDAVAAGELRRGCELAHRLVLVSTAPDALERFESQPEVVAVLERDERHAVGVTVEGIPVELVAARPEQFGTELVRATGSDEYVAGARAAPGSRDGRAACTNGSASLSCRRSCARRRSAASRRRSCRSREIRGDLHCHTTWSDGKASVLEMASAARDRGYEYLAICDHTPNVRVVPGLDADALRRQAEEIAAANEALAPFRVLRGTECDIRADGILDLPDDVLAELEWVQLSLHAGQRAAARRADRARDRGDAASRGPLPQPSAGADPQPPAAERARPRAHDRGRARDRRRARDERPPRPARPAATRRCGSRSRQACRSSARPTRTRCRGSGTCSSR